MLSNKRRMYAEMVGSSAASSVFRSYSEDPTCFPEGLRSLKSLVSTVAAMRLLFNSARKVTLEEERVAAEYAEKLADVFIAAAEAYARNPK